MTSQEKEALTQLKLEIIQLKIDTISLLRIMIMEKENLQRYGYKTLEEAVIGIMGNLEKDISKKEKAFLKKYPD